MADGRQVVSTDKTKSWIQTSAGVCGGEPCIRNTRHTVAGLVEWKKLGLSDHRILEHHPDLTLADLEVAWAYYATHREDIDRILQEIEDA
jgi:uncharacterized protein (DUF433 family)